MNLDQLQDDAGLVGRHYENDVIRATRAHPGIRKEDEQQAIEEHRAVIGALGCYQSQELFAEDAAKDQA